jgi:hypothetical protein
VLANIGSAMPASRCIVLRSMCTRSAVRFGLLVLRYRNNVVHPDVPCLSAKSISPLPPYRRDPYTVANGMFRLNPSPVKNAVFGLVCARRSVFGAMLVRFSE